ncbi:putative ankyrin repeat domain-containing protein 19 isoform X3 [Mastomys coucha]|nr:putative ankyrin repeat domain-containing protein 19 isoform X3 [Mastomys coucha]
MTLPRMGGKYSRGEDRRPLGFPGFSVLCCCQKKNREETPLGFCDIKARRSNLCFGREDSAYLDMTYFPDNDLHMAACAGDLPFVRLYFTLGKYEVNHRDRENRNAMHFACFYGHLELVIYLWRRGCEINVCDNHNITPLMKAVQSWEDEIVCFLLEHHANLHIKDSMGNTALHYAVYGGNSAMAARLLQYGANIEERTKDNLTPLLLALRENRLKMAQFLVKMDASVHAVDSQRRNSLMYAVRCDSPVMVNLILQQGVDINLKDVFGWTALRYAIEGDRDVRTILLEYEYNLIQSLRERTRAFQSSENSSIRPINKADAEVTSPTANEKVIEMQDPFTTHEASMEKIQTGRPGHLGSLQLLATINKATMNIELETDDGDADLPA